MQRQGDESMENLRGPREEEKGVAGRKMRRKGGGTGVKTSKRRKYKSEWGSEEQEEEGCKGEIGKSKK